MAFSKCKKVDIYYTPKDEPRECRLEWWSNTVTYGRAKMKQLFKEGAKEIVLYARYGEDDDPRNFQLTIDEKGVIRRHNNC